jgi:hypothetical protein
MADAPQRSTTYRGLSAFLVVFLVIAALAAWVLIRNRSTTVTDAGVSPVDSTTSVSREPLADSAPMPLTSRSSKTDAGIGAGMADSPSASMTSTALFAGRDIHDVPLGTILDYAQALRYDEDRGYVKRLAKNSAGQSPSVKIWPEAGASSLEEPMLAQGRIVARIESSGSYDNLGLAGGLNYLWVEARPDGGFRGVIIPATAFASLHDIDRVSVSEQTPIGVPLEKGAYWISRDDADVPWIACGRC